MMKFKKIFYILIVISSLSIIIAIVMFIAERKEEARRIKVEKELARIIQEKELIQIKLKKTQDIRDKLKQDLKAAKEKTKTLSSKLELAKGQMQQLKSKLAKQTRIASELRQQLEEERNKREILSEELAQVQSRKQELEIKFEKLKKKKEELESKLKKTDEEMRIQLDKVIVTPQHELPPRVLVVNRDYNFIIVNLGQDSVLKNSVLGIYRDGKLIGKAKVGRTYPNMCSAEIISKSSPIREGDRVEVLK